MVEHNKKLLVDLVKTENTYFSHIHYTTLLLTNYLKWDYL